jgi:glyoxylase I family protein
MDLGRTPLGHLAIRVTDPARSRRFYHEQLGLPVLLDAPQVTLLGLGDLALALLAGPETPAGDRFDPHRVGLDHLALAVADADLDALRARLDEAGVPNNGVQRDDLTGARYVSFYDPDGIAWELYAAPAA